MADIFLSYASDDRTRIEPLVKALEDQGWTVWWDIDLLEGERFRPTIRAALKGARCVVVVWSELSAASDWVLDEADVARKAGKLIPVRFGTEDDIPLGFGGIHTRDFSKWAGETSAPEFLRLCAALRAKLNGPVEPLPPATGPGARKAPPSSHEEQMQVAPRESKERPQDVRDQSDATQKSERSSVRSWLQRRLLIAGAAIPVALALFISAAIFYFGGIQRNEYPVSVQYSGIDRNDIRVLMRTLRRQGWKVQGIELGGEEKKIDAKGVNEVRYSDSEDAAKLLAQEVTAEDFASGTVVPKQVTGIPSKQLEVWISRPILPVAPPATTDTPVEVASWTNQPPDRAYCFQRKGSPAGPGKFLIRCFKTMDICRGIQTSDSGQRTPCVASTGLRASPLWLEAGRGGVGDSWFKYSGQEFIAPFPQF